MSGLLTYRDEWRASSFYYDSIVCSSADVMHARCPRSPGHRGAGRSVPSPIRSRRLRLPVSTPSRICSTDFALTATRRSVRRAGHRSPGCRCGSAARAAWRCCPRRPGRLRTRGRLVPLHIPSTLVDLMKNRASPAFFMGGAAAVPRCCMNRSIMPATAPDCRPRCCRPR